MGFSSNTISLVNDPSNPNTLYTTVAGQGVYKSTDGGNTWTITSADSGAQYIAIAPSNPSILYASAGVSGGGMQKSTDAEVTWTNITSNLPTGAYVQDIVVNPANPNIAYAALYHGNGVWRTTDGGATWSTNGPFLDNYRVVIDPSNANILYAGVGPTNGTGNDVIYKSTDGGNSWFNPGDNGIVGGSNFSAARAIAIDPTNTNTIYIGGETNGLWKSIDGGVNWVQLSNSPQLHINAALAVDYSGNVFVAGQDPNCSSNCSEFGASESIDGGFSWRAIDRTGYSLYTQRFAIFSNDPTNLFATSSTNGVYVYGIVPINQNITVGAITVNPSTVQVSTSLTASANFTDTQTSNTHTATWDWGDTQMTSGTVTESNGSGTVTGAHTYAAAGIYTVKLTVIDNNGGGGKQTYQYVVVYDPSAGWSSGSKTYTSPVGAVTGNSGATGTATFGYQVKYANGSMVPSGKNTVLSFPAGNINFSSTAYEWLVVSGTKVIFKADGTLNGVSGYTALVSGIDQSSTHQNGLIRYQIKDSSGNVVYDTQPGGGDNDDPITSVTKGSIAVH